MIDEIILKTKEVTAWNFSQFEREIDELYSQSSGRSAARLKARQLKAFKDFHAVIVREKNMKYLKK